MKQIPTPLLTLVAGIVITLFSLWIGQNNGLLPVQASAEAPLVDGFFNVMVTIAAALFIVVEGAIVYFVIRYRRRPGDDEDGIPVEGNLPLEAFWTAIPAIIVIGLGLYSVEVFQDMGGFSPGGHQHGAMMSHKGAALVAQAPQDASVAGDMMPLLDASHAHHSHMMMADMEGLSSEEKEKALRVYGFGAGPGVGDRAADVVVDVTGMQYAWLFNYPDSGIMTGELHIPVNRDVQLNLSSKDVIHSFWVPQFRLKQDAIPGEQTELRFTATLPGRYPVVCAELCGSYHGGMRAEVVVHAEGEYEQWLTDNAVAQANGPAGAIATRVEDMTDSEFLAPYGDELGLESESFAHLQASALP